jgi:hypothetical protein
MTATAIVVVFSGLSAASSGANGSIGGLLAMLSAMRFLLGIGVGAEYPCGSVSASEQSEESGISKKAQHRWFTLATSAYLVLGILASRDGVNLLFSTTCRLNDRFRFRCFRLRSPCPVLDFRKQPPSCCLASIARAWYDTRRSRVPLAIEDGGASKVQERLNEARQNPVYPDLEEVLGVIGGHLVCLVSECATRASKSKSLIGCSMDRFLYDIIVYPFGIFSSIIVDK